MFPARFPAAVLEGEKKRLGEMGYASQHQQRPAPAAGGMFKRALMLNRYALSPREQARDCEFLILSFDLTVKDLANADYAVGQVWGVLRANRYLLDQVRDQMGFLQAVQTVKDVKAKWPTANAILIEDAANGPAVIESLTNEIPGIIPITPGGTKEQRAAAVLPLWEAGNIWLPEASHAPWINDFVEEHAAFPAGRHDDQVDAQTQALEYLRHYNPTQLAPTCLHGERVTAGMSTYTRMVH
jgi:predicted phage terminase large subunit-like protein